MWGYLCSYGISRIYFYIMLPTLASVCRGSASIQLVLYCRLLVGLTMSTSLYMDTQTKDIITTSKMCLKY